MPLVVGGFVGILSRFILNQELEPLRRHRLAGDRGGGLRDGLAAEALGAWRLRETSDLLQYGLTVLGVALVGGLVVTLAVSTDPDLPTDDALSVWRSWVIDDLFGLIVITPAIATLRRPRHWSWLRSAEYLVAVAYTAVTTYFIFFVVVPGDQGLFGWPYLVVLGSIWIAVRLGVQAVAPVVALQFWAAILGTVWGRGAFAGAAPEALDRLLAVELFSVSMAAVILTLAVLRDARHRSAAELEAANRFFRDVVNGSEAAIFAKAYDGAGVDGRYVLANQASGRITGLDSTAVIGRTDATCCPTTWPRGCRSPTARS